MTDKILGLKCAWLQTQIFFLLKESIVHVILFFKIHKRNRDKRNTLAKYISLKSISPMAISLKSISLMAISLKSISPMAISLNPISLVSISQNSISFNSISLKSISLVSISLMACTRYKGKKEFTRRDLKKFRFAL